MKVLEQVERFRGELEAALRIVQKLRGEFAEVGKSVSGAADRLASSLDKGGALESVRAAREANRLAEQARKVAQSQKALREAENKILKQRQKLEEEIAFLRTEEAKRLEKLKRERQELAKSIKRGLEEEASAYRRQVGLLNEVKGRLKDLLIKQKELEAAGRQGTQEYAELSKEVESLRVEYERVNKVVREAEESVGEFQRNVGNYAGDIRKVLGEVSGGFMSIGGEGAQALAEVGGAARNAGVAFGMLLKSVLRVNKEGLGGLRASGALAFAALFSFISTAVGKLGAFFGDLADDVSNFFEAFADVFFRTGNVVKAFEAGKQFSEVQSQIRSLERGFGGVEVSIAKVAKRAEELSVAAQDLRRPFKERVEDIKREVALRQEAVELEREYYSRLEGQLRLLSGTILDPRRRAEVEDRADAAAKRRIELETELIRLAGERERKLVESATKSAAAVAEASEKELNVFLELSEGSARTNATFWAQYVEALKRAKGSVIDAIGAIDRNLQAAGLLTGDLFSSLAQKVAQGTASVKDFLAAFEKLRGLGLGEEALKEVSDTFEKLFKQVLEVDSRLGELSLKKQIRDLETYRDLLQVIPDELGSFVDDAERLSEKLQTAVPIFQFDPQAFRSIVAEGRKGLQDIQTLSGVDSFLREQREVLEGSLRQTLSTLQNEYEVRKKLLFLTVKDEEERNREFLRLRAEFYKKVKDAVSDGESELFELERQAVERRKALLEQALGDFQGFSSQIFGLAQENIRRQGEYLLRQQEGLRDVLQVQAQLASRGISNSLVQVEQRLRELEAQRKEREARERRLAKVQAYFNALVEYMKSDPSSAPFKALIQVALAEAIAGRFKEGVEAFKGKGGPKDDANLVLISTGESIITAEATKKYGGLPTAMNEGKVEKWVQERYSSTVDFSELGEWIVTTVRDGVKKREIIRKRPF